MELKALSELGLSNGEIKVYSAVLDLGISSLNRIQEKTGIERRNIYDILNKLIEKGLISYTIEKGKRTYQCVHPSKIIEEIEEKEQSLEELKQQIPNILDIYNSSRPDIKAEVYRGEDAIKSLLNELLDYKESFWMGGNSFENYKAVSKGMQLWTDNWMKRRIENKHIMHDLVSHGTFLRGLEPSKKGKHTKSYYKFSELPKDMYVPMVLIIFGNKVAQVIWGDQPFAFVLESEKIKESYLKYFNYFWKISK